MAIRTVKKGSGRMVPEVPDRCPEEWIDRILRGSDRIRGELWTRKQDLDRLAVAARDGNADAREALWLTVRPRLVRIARGAGVFPTDVPDLVQDAVVAADQSLEGFHPEKGPFRSWMIAILRNLRSNLRRSRARRTVALAGLRRQPRSNGNGKGRLGPIEARLQLDRLLPVLSRRQRTVLILYEIGGLSAYETALILGITPAGVRSIAREARQKLARRVNGTA